jgi:hypothetical protein
MFGEQFLDMGRAVERGGQLPELGRDRRDQNIGKAAALLLGGASCSRSMTARNSASLDLK